MSTKEIYKDVVLSLGGSLIAPEGGINTQFLKDFERWVREKVAEGRRFFIICGGGRTARVYREYTLPVLMRIW
jgi:uridylate kinase